MDVAAFFDLDLTLITVNSGELWVKRERRLGRIRTRMMGRAVLYFGLYRLGLLDMEHSMRLALSLYRGVPEQEIAEWTRQWYEEEIAATVAPGAWSVLEQHRQYGHRLILLTLSSPYEAKLACKQLGLDHAISSQYEVKDGRITGEPVTPLCYGEGKVILSQRFARQAGLDLDRSFFYTDSFTDLPMLERVENPRVVNPDIRLRRVAKKRGWPILDWRNASQAESKIT